MTSSVMLECDEQSAPAVRPSWCRVRVQSVPEGESMTQQSHADSVDVNRIIERFDRTGVLPMATREPMYADVTDLQVDLTEAINRSREVLNTADEFASTWQEKAPEPPPVVAPAAPPPVAPPA